MKYLQVGLVFLALCLTLARVAEFIHIKHHRKIQAVEIAIWSLIILLYNFRQE